MKKALFFPWQISLCAVGCLCASSDIAKAQVTTDGTVNTQVTQDGNVAEITGGQTKGSNLFHSFQDFSVPTGNEAFFNNANEISNIFSRVTGGNISNIDGLIRSNGSASLFLINPAGIIFGENARLDIGGSFYGSSASSILFEEGRFSAVDLENPRLTINAPIGLDFRDRAGDIVNRSGLSETVTLVETGINGEDILYEFEGDRIGLEVNGGKNVALIGGNVAIENSGITAPGGRVTVGGLSQAGVVTFNEDGSFIFPEAIAKADVSLVSDRDSSGRLSYSVLNVRSNTGGAIDIKARDLVARNSNILSGIEAGLFNSVSGDINIDADSISSDNLSIESSISNGAGRGGDINLNADSLALNASFISSNIFSDSGSLGKISLNADLLVLKNSTISSELSNTVGTGGDINLNANSLTLNNSKIRFSNLARQGAVRSISLIADAIDLNDSWIESSKFYGFDFGEGSGADINLIADAIDLNDSRIISGMNTGGRFDRDIFVEGNIELGDINIDANSLALNNNSWIVSDLNYYLVNLGGDTFIRGDIQLGDINIDANFFTLNNNSWVISDINTAAFEGDIFIEGDIELGDISINTNSLLLTNKSDILAQTNTSANASNIQIFADRSITINGVNSSISSQTGGSGNAGEIEIDTSKLNIVNSGRISTSNLLIKTLENPPAGGILNKKILEQPIEGLGNAGTIDVSATDISLSDRGGITSFASTGGGNINLQVDDVLSLRNNSEILATAGEPENPSNAGNINIDADLILAFPNGSNDITANAFDGNGGNIQITTKGMLGIQEREQNPLINDINASSRFNLDSDFSISPAAFIPTKRTTELPSSVVEAEPITVRACQANQEAVTKSGIIQPIETSQGKIQPARGVEIAESGEVILTAHRTNNRGERIPDRSSNCD